MFLYTLKEAGDMDKKGKGIVGIIGVIILVSVVVWLYCGSPSKTGGMITDAKNGIEGKTSNTIPSK